MLGYMTTAAALNECILANVSLQFESVINCLSCIMYDALADLTIIMYVLRHNANERLQAILVLDDLFLS